MNMILSPTDFLYNGTLFYRDFETGRCYRLAEPSGLYSRAARKGLLANKRISFAYYNECLEACRIEEGAQYEYDYPGIYTEI